jgi:hypothetical protein
MWMVLFLLRYVRGPQLHVLPLVTFDLFDIMDPTLVNFSLASFSDYP